jgi:hypothetical protein
MKKNSVGLLEVEKAVSECFLEKTPLSPLGVKKPKRKLSKGFSQTSLFLLPTFLD